MPDKTSISVNFPTRDLIREVMPSWMEYDEFMLELLMQYEPSELHLNPQAMSYEERVAAMVEAKDVDTRAITEIDLVELEDQEDAAPVSS